MWGLSGHVLEDDKESAAEIKRKAVHFTPRLDVFVTILVLLGPTERSCQRGTARPFHAALPAPRPSALPTEL